MFLVRQGPERGHFNHSWLDTYHTFSFGDYYDPAQMGFSALRVINEDRIAGGGGFGMHGHRDMEIVTLVLSGTLEHQDSLGNGGQLRPGELQHMSAGRGIRHSEFNPSATESVHLYQIWLLPRQTGLEPSYSQQAFDTSQRQGRWQLVASPDGLAGSLKIQQDARLYLSNLKPGDSIEHEFHPARRGWLQVLRGKINVDNQGLVAGDAIALENEPRLACKGDEPSELLLFDLP